VSSSLPVELEALDVLHRLRQDLLRRVREGAISALPALHAVEDIIAEREEALTWSRSRDAESAA